MKHDRRDQRWPAASTEACAGAHLRRLADRTGTGALLTANGQFRHFRFQFSLSRRIAVSKFVLRSSPLLCDKQDGIGAQVFFALGNSCRHERAAEAGATGTPALADNHLSTGDSQ